MKTKKYDYRNMRINTRVTISTVSAILASILVITILAFMLRFFLPSFYNFAEVTTDNYSLLNQIQWSQTITRATKELLSNDSDTKKKERLDEYSKSIKTVGADLCIIRDNNVFYSTEDAEKIYSAANKIVAIDMSKSINYFGENGLVIISHAESNDTKYTILIVDDIYTVKDISERYSPQDITSLVIGKTGIIIAVTVFIFILSISLMSFITSKSISDPIKKLSDGATEIANGNLDYKIDYESTNEIGTTVNSINNMARRLKKSIDERNVIDQSRKEMIAGVAHDLRTPLTSVKGYVEGIMDGIANTPEKQKQYISTIYSSTLDMEKLLDELFEVSKLELGKITLEQSPVNLNVFINEYIEEVSFMLDKHDFRLEYSNNNPDGEIMVMLDADRFSRVLSNLVSNSIKYAGKEENKRMGISIQDCEKTVTVSVSDNGIGVSKENLVKIFDTFYRADQARTKVREGSGLGLAVCKEIVELHGGHIWADGEEGEGLTINISLDKILEDENER